MINQERIPKKDDIPLGLAAAILGVVVIAVTAGSSLTSGLRELSALGPVFEENMSYLSVAVVSASFTAAWVSTQWRRRFKLTKQGSRLESLVGKKPNNEKILPKLVLGSLVGGIAFLVCLWVPTENSFPMHATPLQHVIWNTMEMAAALSLASSGFALSFALEKPMTWLFRRRETGANTLPAFPAIKNAVTLGAINEDIADTAPSWLTVDKRALNGNVLITGSIGAGKTQGTILTYFDQILTNFDPLPSVLIIDPKGTFAPEVLKIIESKGLMNQCLHFTLEGDLTFNPVYALNALRGAKFMDIAYMLQSAASNFMGRSSGSSFWETHSLTLIRHSLAYCAAKSSYYTLLDLNEAILLAVGDDLPEKLKELLETKEFNQEERFNVMRAYDYFALEFRKLEDKVRTSILATATAFLNQFQEYQANRIFCPKQGQAQLASLDEAVDTGKIIIVDISSPALAKSMGTMIKLLFQQSVLDRLKNPGRKNGTPALLLIDEYQDVVTTSSGTSIGDERFFAKAREADAISIVATQSQTSLQDAIGRETSAKSLFQCFRTRIGAHSSDPATIHAFQELIGQEDREKISHSFSELSQDAKMNHMIGGFESNNANISESFSKSMHRESVVTGKEFFSLSSFEAFGLIYDGIKTRCHRLYLKPYFLGNKAIWHKDLLAKMAATTGLLLTLLPVPVFGFPNVCSVVKTPEFSTCMEFKVSGCTCGFPPRPCAQFNYYVPTSFIEVHPNPGETFFGDLPAARAQLLTLGVTRTPYGAEGDSDTQSFHAHTLAVPLASIGMAGLPCHSSFRDSTCFESMSEHLGPTWATGTGDQTQPNFLVWLANPKACLLAGAAQSLAGGNAGTYSTGSRVCSVPMLLPVFPPSSHGACNGWGTFFPRVGTYSGPSQTAGALMIASRMKSLAAEVFDSTPSHPGEKWQMITPQSSACFREGENMSFLETFKHATELRRLGGGPPKGYLFAVWKPVSCCRDLGNVPAAQAVLAAMKATCQGGGPW